MSIILKIVNNKIHIANAQTLRINSKNVQNFEVTRGAFGRI